MKKLLYLLILLVLPISLFLSCEAEEVEKETPQEKELLEITKLQVPETGGIQLEATYTGNADIAKLKTGFLVSKNETPTSSNARDIPGTISGNRTSGESGSDFVYNEQYYVRAYLVHPDGKILYSEADSFVSLGSKPPEIREMNRSLILDTVNIKGKNFTAKRYYVKVKLDAVYASVIEANDTLIQFIVPENLERHDPLITVEVYGKTAVYQEFSLLPPSIEKISANSAALGDTLTVYGKNFDFENSRNTMTLGGTEVKIFKSTRDSIQFQVPDRVSASTLDLKLTTQLQDVSLPTAVVIKKPVITAVPEGFKAYETIEISGTNFSKTREDNRIFFNELPAEVLEASTTKLKIRVPIGPYPDRKPKLRIEFLDYNIPYEGDFSLTDIWLMKSRMSSGHVFRGAKYFVHNNRAYLFEDDYQDPTRWKVRVMDPTTETWTQFFVQVPSAELQGKDFSIIYNRDSGRLFFYFSVENNNFYEFDLAARTFSLQEDFPGVARGIPGTFSIDDQLYIVLGRYMDWGSHDRALLSKLWTFNVNTETWEEVAPFPHSEERSDLSIFVIDGEAYLGNGASDTGDIDFWKYSPANDQWTRLADFPGARLYTSFFEYGGKAYVFFGSAMENPGVTAIVYDPAIDQWDLIDPVNEFYYTYFIYPEGSLALRFDDAIYLGMTMYPNIEFFKADLSRL